MAMPSKKLAESLEVLEKIQSRNGSDRISIIPAKSLSRTHRVRLVANGFLKEVIKGWYIPTRPNEISGESTAWYTSFWRFCADYLKKRFGSAWCLSPEQSLSLHAGNWTVPTKLIVRAPLGRNKITNLPHHTSLLTTRAELPAPEDCEEKNGLRIFSLESALVACHPDYFFNHATDVGAALSMIPDGSGLLARLLDGGHSKIACRLVSAFRKMGRIRIAEDIVKTMTSAGYDMREVTSFPEDYSLVIPLRETSPYVNRMRLLWQKMRPHIVNSFPEAPGLPKDVEAYLQSVNDAYVTDAYHSLSIEGYQVSRELIERVRNGLWDPKNNEGDRDQRNAMAARGYWLSFQAVQKSLRRVLLGEQPGQVIDEDHGAWYRELFTPSIMAGFIKPADLAGYRNSQVYIRNSMHVPLNRLALREAMPAFFDLLREETEPAVRVVLGHFLFVYIHPYIDGNGRIGRFLMNVMMASGGYPWTIIPVETRHTYINALEQASVYENIAPFTDFLACLVEKQL